MAQDDRVNILLVDDRPENLVALKAILHDLGQNLVEARSGREALKQLLEKEFAVILLDVMMPDMDGFETARLIREREKSRHTPIIFVTAMFTDDTHAFKGYSVGAVDYIMKPFVPDILRSKVAVFIDLFKKTEEVKRQSEIIREIEQREYELRLADAQRRMQAESERVRAEQRMAHAIIQHSPLGVVRLDSSLVVREVNSVFSEQFDVLPDALVGKTLTEAMPGLPDAFVESCQQGKPMQLEMIQVASVAGDETKDDYYDLATWPVTDEAGSVIGTIIIVMDVTERVRLDLQRKDFVATLAHDLQTPVIASDRALELLLNQLSATVSPSLINLVQMLKKNNQNLLHMIQSLLEIYQYEAGAQTLYFDDVDLKILTSTCIDELMPIAQKQKVNLTASFPTKFPTVPADRTALRRVITNLLDNSIKFTPQGGSIEVSGSADGLHLVLEVTDSGTGISLEDQKHLFERYWHGSSHKSFKRSSGLGLYLCKQIVEAHKGQIECESEVGKMTRFRVRLPLTPANGTDAGYRQMQNLKPSAV